MLPALLLFCMLPASPDLDRAYGALRARDYETAITLLRQAAQTAPGDTAVRKNLGYALLKVGETEQARDEFAAVMRVDPGDCQAALEYAFLCHETRRTAEARRVFGRLRTACAGNAKAAAEQAFRNIDAPIAAGIARWSAALELDPENFSAHLELARLAELREEYRLAAQRYQDAYRLKPQEGSILIDLARVWRALGETARAEAALGEAARSPDTRTAESARAMSAAGRAAGPAAETAGAPAGMSAAAAPESGGLRVSRRPGACPTDFTAAKAMAEKSYKLGYMKDALRYLELAHAGDPQDYSVILKLAWTHNILHQDDQAVRWFSLARKSPDPRIAAEASRAYRNLRRAPLQTTAWLLPFYSSRWQSVLSYGQVKTEFRLGSLPVRPYISTRFAGDARGTTGGQSPQFLSERSFLFGAGLATRTWRGLTAWAEAANSVAYARRNGMPRAAPDYRGGVALFRSSGAGLGGESHGAFFETNADAVFLSRFENDLVVYSQNRAGYTLPRLEALGFEWQLFINANATQDVKNQYWARFVEAGPGVRFRFRAMPPSLSFSVSALRGVYTRNEGNPYRPNFIDVRAGFWYAFTR